jgi:amino acid transporter
VRGAPWAPGPNPVFCSYAPIIAFGPGHIGALVADPNPFHTAAQRFNSPLAPLITWIFLTSVTSSYVPANTQTARVIFAGARGGLWAKTLASVSPRFRTPWAAAIACVAPSIAIGVISTAFTDPGTAVGLLSTYGILGLVLMYLMANIALIVQWARFRRAGCARTCGPGS